MRAIQILKSDLEELYLNQGQSLRAIAKRYRCDAGVIGRALARYNIPARHPTAPRHLSKKQLEILYTQENLSTYAIATQLSCDPKTVYRYLKMFGIPVRPIKRISLDQESLQRLYLQERMSLQDVATEYGYSAAGVLKKLKEYGIQRRTLSETNTKHVKCDFAGSKGDKAYMIGFRLGDLGVRDRKNLIYVSSGTTKDAQINLIRDLFSPYGPVWVGRKNDKGACNVSALLNRSFSFLLPKHKTVPRWILCSSSYFFSFLAGYTDAEGNFSIAGGSARMRLRSYDTGILQDLHAGLLKRGVACTLRLESRAGTNVRGVKQNKDCWGLAVVQKGALHTLLPTLLPLLRHEKRLADATAAMGNVSQRML